MEIHMNYVCIWDSKWKFTHEIPSPIIVGSYLSTKTAAFFLLTLSTNVTGFEKTWLPCTIINILSIITWEGKQMFE